MSEQNGFDPEGMRVRRAVLGADHVDKSVKNANDFTLLLQQFVTEYCWGTVWTRPGLSLQVRSLLNLGMLSALGRQHELAAHVRGAVNNGCTVGEIQEALLQATVYCGVPAGMEAFRTADEVLRSMGLVLIADGNAS